MIKKIIAIGGGENGREIQKGIFLPYETKEIDQEIVALTNKDKPNFLLSSYSSINISYKYVLSICVHLVIYGVLNDSLSVLAFWNENHIFEVLFLLLSFDLTIFKIFVVGYL